MKYFVFIAIFLALATASAKGNKKAGRGKAETCFACHGVDGKGTQELWPNLAGQKYEYLVKQIKDFKAGRRKDPLMDDMVTSLSDQDIEDIAAYFSSLR